jgi:hypothetical protein
LRLISGIGKAPLGFLNPWLYKNAGMLNDIKDGELLPRSIYDLFSNLPF